MNDLLDRVLTPDPPPFAILHRPEATGGAVLEVLVGDVTTVDSTADIVLPEHGSGPRLDVLAIVPYRQITERGYACADDEEPLVTLTVRDQARFSLGEALDRLPDEPITLAGGDFDVDDDTYADTVRRIIEDEIGTGEGANFVIRRSYTAEITGYTPRSALSFFRRLVTGESNAYWTFVVYTGTRTFVGATPERHVSLRGGTAVMNPISGTYRYPPSGPVLPEVLDFLDDRKESDELYMVVDEELKMMARICDRGGGRVFGPYLKEMARLAHTEYFIEGHSDRDPRDILHETMFAPTVTGSPLESACRVIARYEPGGRGYYSGVMAVIGRDDRGEVSLDSSILIRTADIDSTGAMRIGVGATLVRHSDPVSEVAETRAKAAGLLAALQTGGPARFADHPRVLAALARRNATIARFWQAENGRATGPAGISVARETLEPGAGGRTSVTELPVADLAGREVLVVDAEDTFTSMLDHQLRAMGLSVTVRRFDEPHAFDGYDLVVMGPGPGDPRDTGHPKIARLRADLGTLLARRQPFLAVCLSHQVLCLRLGLPVERRDVPNQGLQKEIDLFGRRELVGFYNTFAARSGEDKVECDGLGVVEVSRDLESGEVHALSGPFFSSLQFHAESVLTQDGIRIVSERVSAVLNR